MGPQLLVEESWLCLVGVVIFPIELQTFGESVENVFYFLGDQKKREKIRVMVICSWQRTEESHPPSTQDLKKWVEEWFYFMGTSPRKIIWILYGDIMEI